MKNNSATIDELIQSLPEERKKAITELRKVIKKNLSKGFSEGMGYGMIAYIVPHSVYPPGYHVDPTQPLPYMCIASQKNHIAVYHMGIYANKKLLDWFISEYKKVSKNKLDMGKSCIRFKKPEEIPFELIGKLTAKITADEWIKLYEKNLPK